jgi:hypothetical protein
VFVFVFAFVLVFVFAFVLVFVVAFAFTNDSFNIGSIIAAILEDNAFMNSGLLTATSIYSRTLSSSVGFALGIGKAFEAFCKAFVLVFAAFKTFETLARASIIYITLKN